MRTLVRRMLDSRCDVVVEAANGKEALALVKDATKIDLLITDVKMPEMEGHELSSCLRRQNPDLKVLYVTGFADHLFEKKDRLWDLEAYLDKPFTQKALNEAVALLMSGRLSFDS